MAHGKHSVTQAVRMLRSHRVAFTEHPYAYEERGGTAVSARELGVPYLELAAAEVARFHSDMDALGMRPPAAEPSTQGWEGVRAARRKARSSSRSRRRSATDACHPTMRNASGSVAMPVTVA